MTNGPFQAVCLTALGCVVAAFAVLHLLARKHDREQFRRDEQWRERMWQQATGAAMPVLSDADRAEFRALASRLKRQDAGLDVISSERGGRS